MFLVSVSLNAQSCLHLTHSLFRRAWHHAHAPTATMKLVSCYFPIHSSYNIPDLGSDSDPQRGSSAYYFRCIGGRPGLARLYIEAGMLYLEGTASSLVTSSHSSLASIRMPLQPYGSTTLAGGSGTEAWRRDRVAAARLFERAKVLQPGLETPALPLADTGSMEELTLDPEIQMQMPSMELDGVHRVDTLVETRNRRRRGKEQEDVVRFQKEVGKVVNDVENTWYMLIPGLVGVGTALVVVGVVGVLSLSWSRRNQGS